MTEEDKELLKKIQAEEELGFDKPVELMTEYERNRKLTKYRKTKSEMETLKAQRLRKGSVPDAMRTEPGDNARILLNSLVGWSRPKTDLSNPQETEEAITSYFQHCIDTDIKPGVMGMANWLGVYHSRLEEILKGQCYAQTQPIIARAYDVLKLNWEQYMLEGKINPVVGIFLGKSCFGMKDTQEIVVSNGGVTERLSNAELIAASKQLPSSKRKRLESPKGDVTMVKLQNGEAVEAEVLPPTKQVAHYNWDL